MRLYKKIKDGWQLEAGQPKLQTKEVEPIAQKQSVTPDEGYDGLAEVVVGAVRETGNGEVDIKQLNVTKNGTYTNDGGGFNPVYVNVPSDAKEEQTKNVTVTENGTQTITPDAGKVLSGVKVTVNVDGVECDVPTVDTLPDDFYGLAIGDKVLLSADNCIYQVAWVNEERPGDGLHWVKLSVAPSGSTYINANGTYNVAEYENVEVNVPSKEPNLQEKTATSNGAVTPDNGYDGLSKVNVAVPSDAKEEQTKEETITVNETAVFTPDAGKTLSKVTVHVNVPSKEPNLQNKQLDVTENKNYDIQPDEGYDGLQRVMVDVNVPEKKLHVKEIDVTGNGFKEIHPDEGYDGMQEVYVNVNIPSDAKPEQSKEVTITSNGSQTVTPDTGKTLSDVKITVNVPSEEPNLQEDKFITLTENGTHNITPDEGYDGLAGVGVTVNVPIPEGYVKPTGTKQVTSNGTHDVTNYQNVKVSVPEKQLQEGAYLQVTENGSYDVKPDEGYDGIKRVMVDVDVPEKKLQVKEVEITANGDKTITPDANYDGLQEVYVNVDVPQPTLGRAYLDITENNDSFIFTAGDEGYDGLTEVEVTVSIPSYVKVLDEWPEDLSEYNVGDFIYFPGDNEMCQVRYINEEDTSEGKDLYYMCVPRGEIEITENGSYDIDGLAYAEVNVNGTDQPEEWNAWEDAQEITDTLVTLGSVAGAKFVKFDRLVMQDWAECPIKFEVPEVFPFRANEYFYIGILDEGMVQMPIKIDKNFILYIENNDGFIGENGMIQEICYAITPR